MTLSEGFEHGPEAPGAAPAGTAGALLDAAERLFAEHGFDAVSLRRIVLDSGQGNLSAAHYHFGSREGLIRAVLERRMRSIDAVRHRRLEAVAARGEADSLPALVEAAIGALADVVRDEPWGADYVRVMSRVLYEGQLAVPESLAADATGSLQRAKRLARALLPEVPQSEYDDRVRMLHHGSVHEIARWVREHGRPVASNRRAYRTMVRRVVAFVAAGLAAPPAPRG